MKKFWLKLIILTVICPSFLFAHGPTRQKVRDSVTIRVEIGKAWRVVADLKNIGKWHAEYKSIQGKGDGLRPISFFSSGDGTIQIISYDEDKKLIKYRLKKPGSIPVNNYSGIIKLEEIDGDNTKLVYKSAFYRKYLNNDPPPEENDEAAVQAVSDILKKTFVKVKEALED